MPLASYSISLSSYGVAGLWQIIAISSSYYPYKYVQFKLAGDVPPFELFVSYYISV